MLLFLLACSQKPAVDFGPPVLPAMEAPLYAAAPYTPGDGLVAAVLGEGVQADESLSGAAAAVALAHSEGASIDGSAVTWAAYRSGWPHAVLDWQLVRVPEGERPGRDFEQALEGWRADGAAIGVARARGGSGDTWVALRSRAWVDLGAFPREWSPGATFSWPVTDDGGYGPLRQLAVGPGLDVREGELELDAAGEWVTELRGQRGGGEVLLARVPLYVGQPTPEDGPFVEPVDTDTPEAILRALDELRGLERAPTLRGDSALDAAAQEGLRALLHTGAPDPGSLDRLARLGYPEAAELTCSGGTVTECLEDLWWSIDDRRLLLQPDYRRVGVAAARGEVLTVVLTLAGQ